MSKKARKTRRKAEDLPENAEAVETLKMLYYIYLELSYSPHHEVREYAKRYRYTIFVEALRGGLNMQSISRLTAISPHAVSNVLLGSESIKPLAVDEDGIPEACVDIDVEVDHIKPLPLLSQIFEEART